MKLLILILTLSVVGCATAIPYKPVEQCAQDDMTLGGISHDSSSASGFAYDNRGRLVSANANAYGSSVHCSTPRNESEKKQVLDTKRAMAPKDEYNQGISLKRLITGVGYVAFVVPGVVMKFVYDGQYDRAVEKSDEIARQNSSAEPAALRPPASEK